MIMHFMSRGNKESQSDYIQSQGLVSFICLCQDLFISTFTVAITGDPRLSERFCNGIGSKCVDGHYRGSTGGVD